MNNALIEWLGENLQRDPYWNLNHNVEAGASKDNPQVLTCAHTSDDVSSGQNTGKHKGYGSTV